MPVEPVEGVVHDEVDDGPVIDAGEFDVFGVHAEFLGGLVEGAGAGHRYAGICVALADEQGHVRRLLELFGAAKTGDGGHGGESLGVVESDPHGAAAAHRMSHDVDALRVDRIGRLDQV